MALDEKDKTTWNQEVQRLIMDLLAKEKQLSHRQIKAALMIPDEPYEEIKAALLASGDVISLRCRGGGLRLPAPKEFLPEVDEKKIEEVKEEQAAFEAGKEVKDEKTVKIEKAEKDLYPHVKQWADYQGYSHVHIIGDNHRRDRWENPDVVALVHTQLNWLVGHDIEITSIEVKLAIDITSVWQAANYLRFSHYVYLASFQSEKELRSEGNLRIFESAVNLGLGILSIAPAGQGARGVQVKEIQSPRRQSPSALEIDSFLTDFEDLLDLTHPGKSIIEQQSDALGRGR